MSELLETADQIIEGNVQERCVGCYRPELASHNLARKVLSAEIDLAGARELLHTDLAEHCRYGLERPPARPGAFAAPMPNCRYGVACQMPPGPSVHPTLFDRLASGSPGAPDDR